MNYLKILFLVLALGVFHNASADPPPPPGGGGGGGSTSAPVDGASSVLLIAAAAYGYSQLRKKDSSAEGETK